MPEQALLDAGARLVGKTQMDELVRSFPNCSLILAEIVLALAEALHACLQCAAGTTSTGWACSRICDDQRRWSLCCAGNTHAPDDTGHAVELGQIGL